RKEVPTPRRKPLTRRALAMMKNTRRHGYESIAHNIKFTIKNFLFVNLIRGDRAIARPGPDRLKFLVQDLRNPFPAGMKRRRQRRWAVGQDVVGAAVLDLVDVVGGLDCQ